MNSKNINNSLKLNLQNDLDINSSQKKIFDKTMSLLQKEKNLQVLSQFKKIDKK